MALEDGETVHNAFPDSRFAMLDGEQRSQTVKLLYDPSTDSLYIDLGQIPSVDSFEVAEGVVIDIDAKGGIAGIDIDHASRRLDLDALETIEELPGSS